MDSELALDLRGVAKLYGRTAALRTVTLRLAAGQALVLLGPNGSGKTTLLKIIAGAISPTLGSGTVLGHDLRSGRFALRSEIGLLASESYLYDDLTAAENLRFILTMAGYKPEQAEIAAVLADVGLSGHAQDRVRSFSSGMRRRLSLARLLVLHPRLVLLDEPYNSLDTRAAQMIDDLVRRSIGAGKTIVLSTHDAERGLALADQVAVLDDGRMVYFGSVTGYRVRHVQHVG
jgi:heme exporter protein A